MAQPSSAAVDETITQHDVVVRSRCTPYNDIEIGDRAMDERRRMERRRVFGDRPIAGRRFRRHHQ
jgi:hypothetical protein